VALVTHLAFELRTSTPDSLVAALAERVESTEAAGPARNLVDAAIEAF